MLFQMFSEMFSSLFSKFSEVCSKKKKDQYGPQGAKLLLLKVLLEESIVEIIVGSYGWLMWSAKHLT